MPIALASLRVAAALLRADAVTAGVDAAITGLPAGHGTPQALRTLTDTALGMSWLQTLVVLFPASLYGEGLSRAFLQLAPPGVVALLAAAPLVGPLYAAGGWHLVLGIVVAFHVVWVLVYGSVAAGHAHTWALLAAGFCGASCRGSCCSWRSRWSGRCPPAASRCSGR